MNSPITALMSTDWFARLTMAASGEASPSATALAEAEHVILRRLCAGDRDALECLIRKHSGVVYSCIRHRVRSAEVADDLFQETWIRVIERSSTYKPEYAFLPWLYRIAINVVNDDRRSKAAMRRGGGATHVPLENADLAASASANPADLAILDQQRSTLHQAVMDLPEPYGEVVRLRYFEELSVAEVAEVLECAEGTVKSRLSRGLACLQTALGIEP